MVEILVSDAGNMNGDVFKTDLDAWVNAYKLPVTTVKDPDDMQGTSLTALYRREIVYIVDLKTMKIVDRFDGSIAGIGPSSVQQAIAEMMTLLGPKGG